MGSELSMVIKYIREHISSMTTLFEYIKYVFIIDTINMRNLKWNGNIINSEILNISNTQTHTRFISTLNIY